MCNAGAEHGKLEALAAAAEGAHTSLLLGKDGTTRLYQGSTQEVRAERQVLGARLCVFVVVIVVGSLL